MPFCWRKLRHPKHPFVTGRSQAVRVSATAVRRQKMDFVIFPGALRIPGSTDKRAALEWLPKAGTDIFCQASREFIR